jgi:hypothetical protein
MFDPEITTDIQSFLRDLRQCVSPKPDRLNQTRLPIRLHRGKGSYDVPSDYARYNRADR